MYSSVLQSRLSYMLVWFLRKYRAGLHCNVATEATLQVVGANHRMPRRLPKRPGFKALLIVERWHGANSRDMPDLGISMMDDVLSDVSRITDASLLPARGQYRSGWMWRRL